MTSSEAADNAAGLDLPEAVAALLVFLTPSWTAFSEPLEFGSVLLFAFKLYQRQKVTSQKVA